MRRPADSSTTRRPSPSIPRAMPAPPDQSDLPSQQGVACPPGLERRPGGLRQAAPERLQQPRQRWLELPRREPHRRRRAIPPGAQLGGQVLEPHGHVQTDPQHGPRFLQAALDEDPGNLREGGPVLLDHDVVGPLDLRPSPTTSATATAAASGSIREGSRRTTDSSSELPAGAAQARPCRPRPALCSPAVTIVPWGAPASASSRARELVESVRRRCSRGTPRTGALIVPAAGPPRPGRRGSPRSRRRCRGARPRGPA